jgi:very-short-patch-repair endonuclease
MTNLNDRGWVIVKRKIISYNPILKERARWLRQNMTFSEVILWNEIKNGQLMGYDFDRQRPIGNYIVDFYCKDLQLALEVDGITHEEESVRTNDLIRQAELEKQGISFLRFDALLVVNKVEAAIREIRDWIINYEKINTANENVQRKRKKINDVESGMGDPPLPLQGGDAF